MGLHTIPASTGFRYVMADCRHHYIFLKGKVKLYNTARVLLSQNTKCNPGSLVTQCQLKAAGKPSVILLRGIQCFRVTCGEQGKCLILSAWLAWTRSVLYLQQKVTRLWRAYDNVLCQYIMYLPRTGWFLLWVSLWRSWTCRWSGSPWALSGRGCCCLKMFNRASSTPHSSVSGSSSVVNTSWLAPFTCSLLYFSPYVHASYLISFNKKSFRTKVRGIVSQRTGGRLGWWCSAHLFSSYLTWVKGSDMTAFGEVYCIMVISFFKY